MQLHRHFDVVVPIAVTEEIAHGGPWLRRPVRIEERAVESGRG
jgi:hypothetical protein